jgi:hypothetical protein
LHAHLELETCAQTIARASTVRKAQQIVSVLAGGSVRG